MLVADRLGLGHADNVEDNDLFVLANREQSLLVVHQYHLLNRFLM